MQLSLENHDEFFRRRPFARDDFAGLELPYFEVIGQPFESRGIVIRDGILCVVKGGVIPSGFSL